MQVDPERSDRAVGVDNSSGLDLNSSASDLLRDCVGAFPPFALVDNSILPIQTGSAQGEMPLEKYRRLRLCRAVGALPYTAAIPAGLSSDDDGTQARSGSGQVKCGQFRGGVSAVIWNCQARFCAKDERRLEKSNYIHFLAARYDIILLSEVHGLRGAPELWRPPMDSMLIGPWGLQRVPLEWAF